MLFNLYLFVFDLFLMVSLTQNNTYLESFFQGLCNHLGKTLNYLSLKTLQDNIWLDLFLFDYHLQVFHSFRGMRQKQKINC